MENDLEGKRRQASLASGGFSNGAIYDIVLAALDRYGASGDALDFGAGQGYFASLLRTGGRFRRVVAADLMPRPDGLAKDIDWLQADLNDRMAIANGSFDTVTAVEMVEHLENPRAMLRECFRILRPGGLLLLTTPNNESVRSLLNLAIRGHFAAFGEQSYPAHITALLRIDLLRVSREAGFAGQSISYSDEGMVPGLTRLTWRRLTMGHARGRRFSDNVMLACRRPEA